MNPENSLSFSVVDMRPEPYAVTPILTARIAITASGDQPVHAAVLRAQVRVQPNQRTYSEEESAGLVEVFGPPERWAQTQRSFLWRHCATTVPGFSGSTQVDLPLECSYDFEVTGSKYLHALQEGAVPLLFLFSGTVFFRGSRGFAVGQIPWDREHAYQMPVAVWRELMAAHYPNAGWVRLRPETMAALAAFKAQHGLLDFDETLARLLDTSKERL